VRLPRVHSREVEHFSRVEVAVTYCCPKYFVYVVLPWSLAKHSVLSLNRRFLVSEWNRQKSRGHLFPFLPNWACVQKGRRLASSQGRQESVWTGEAKNISFILDQLWENCGAEVAKLWGPFLALADTPAMDSVQTSQHFSSHLTPCFLPSKSITSSQRTSCKWRDVSWGFLRSAPKANHLKTSPMPLSQRGGWHRKT
jgi:hypothetical protein